MRTIVYIDAFNFYFGALKGTPYKWLDKWLDFGKLCSLLLPHNRIIAIKYFTARVRPLPHDPDQPTRQQVYWRALRSIPNFSIYEGHFLVHSVSMPLAKPPLTGPRFVEVIKMTDAAGTFHKPATW